MGCVQEQQNFEKISSHVVEGKGRGPLRVLFSISHASRACDAINFRLRSFEGIVLMIARIVPRPFEHSRSTTVDIEAADRLDVGCFTTSRPSLSLSLRPPFLRTRTPVNIPGNFIICRKIGMTRRVRYFTLQCVYPVIVSNHPVESFPPIDFISSVLFLSPSFVNFPPRE